MDFFMVPTIRFGMLYCFFVIAHEFDKLFWVAVSRVSSRWKQSIIVVTPETVVRWHQVGFRMYWRLLSRVRGPVGRRPTPKDRRRILHCNVTKHPTSLWVVQQLREAFPFGSAPRF